LNSTVFKLQRKGEYCQVSVEKDFRGMPYEKLTCSKVPERKPSSENIPLKLRIGTKKR